MICMVVGARPGLFKDFGLPLPDVHLEVAPEVPSGSHAEQTARLTIGFEQVCLKRKPRLVVVGGGVNSTIACALAATKPFHAPSARFTRPLTQFTES